MGLYINSTQNGQLGYDKVKGLIDAGAKVLGRSTPEYQDNLICVVDNGAFEAAGYAFDKREFECFAEPDPRPKVWLTWDRVKEFAK